MSWLSTKTASYIGVGEETKPSDIQKKVFHLKFDYRVYNQNKVELSPIKQKKRKNDPVLEKKRKRKLKIRKKKVKRLQQQHAFQKAKQNLLSILFAEKDMKHGHVREVMELSWNTHKHIILKGETHASPIHHRLQEIHEKEMVLLAAAKKGTQKKMRAKEIGLNEGKEHHELVDEDIYNLALEFADKKENKEKVDKVKLEFQKQKLEAGLSQYVEEKRVETRDARKKKAEETAKAVSENVHARIARPASRESGPQFGEENSNKMFTNDKLVEQNINTVSQDKAGDVNKNLETKEGKTQPESDENVNNDKKEIIGSLKTGTKLVPIDGASPRLPLDSSKPSDSDGNDTDKMDAAGKELYYQALGLSLEAKHYRMNKYKSSIKYQENITKTMLNAKRRVWALREKYRPVHRKNLEIPEGYELKDGSCYTLRSYSHCNGFINPHFKYIGTKPYRCCPTRGEPRHLYDRIYMLLEKAEPNEGFNKFVGKWTSPVYNWIRDFKCRQDAIQFGIEHGIKDIRV